MKLNKLLLTTSLVPIAVVPAMVTSCNKNTKIDDLHLMVEYERSYLPKACIDEKTHELILQKYNKGLHTFVLEEINSSNPVYEFSLELESTEWKISKTNFEVTLNGESIKDQWKISAPNAFVLNGGESAAIPKGKITFTIELLEDVEEAGPCFNPD